MRAPSNDAAISKCTLLQGAVSILQLTCSGKHTIFPLAQVSNRTVHVHTTLHRADDTFTLTVRLPSAPLAPPVKYGPAAEARSSTPSETATS